MSEGKVFERFLDERLAVARIVCAAAFIPAPGQYLLAHAPASDDPLAIPVFSAGLSADGFLAASPLPAAWTAGTSIHLRGPRGRGFTLPAAARRVALAAWDVSPAYLMGLISVAQAQGAAISLVCSDSPEDLPSDVEIRPLAALEETCQWADYLALAVTRVGWRAGVCNRIPRNVPREAQVLIVTPMPCGGLATCGVCSVEIAEENVLPCQDGPVFHL